MKNPITEKRLAAGYTQAQLSHYSGLNIRQLQKLEAGEIKPENITLKNAIQLSRALNCEPADLLPEPPELLPVGEWWNSDYGEIPIYRIDGKLYALDGWNGEEWGRCWECINEFAAANDAYVDIAPQYRFQWLEKNGTPVDFDTIEENGPEWERLIEIVDLSIR